MSVLAILPARYGSTRFPGKPLAPIAGLPMIQRTWQGAVRSQRLRDVIIATDDARILEAARAFGASVALTRADHPTGTDRLAEVAEGLDDDIVVNIQGDEPLIQAPVLEALIDALASEPRAAMSTVVHPLAADAVEDRNRVKARLDEAGRAVDFTRQVTEPGYDWQHAGLYAYRRSFLLEFVRLERTKREEAEGLEQLRALGHGRWIQAAIVDDWHSIPVDVPADVRAVEQALIENAREQDGGSS